MSPPPAAAATADVAPVMPSVPRLAAPAVPSGTLPAIAFIVTSTVFFCAGDIAAKTLADTLHGIEITFLRFLFFASVMVPLVLLTRGPTGLVARSRGLQVARGAALAGAGALFIVGLGSLPVAENTAIAFLSPLFVTALSIPLLGETVGLRRWMAGLVGFCGVMLIVRPGSEAFQLAALLPILSAAVGAFGTVLTRKMPGDAPETTLVWSSVVGLVVLSVAMPFVWQTPTLADLPAVLASGLFSTLGHVCVVLGYRRAPASLIAPFSYTQLPTACLFSYLVFGILPTAWTIAGIAVIAASGLYTAHRERMRAAN